MQSNKLQLNVAISILMLIGSHQKLKDCSVSILIGGRLLPQMTSTEYLGLITDLAMSYCIHC